MVDSPKPPTSPAEPDDGIKTPEPQDYSVPPAWKFLGTLWGQSVEKVCRAMDRRTAALEKVAAALERHGVALATLAPRAAPPSPAEVRNMVGQTAAAMAAPVRGPMPAVRAPEMPQGPPPGWRPSPAGGAPQGRPVARVRTQRERMAPGQIAAMIREGVSRFQAMQPGSFPDSMVFEPVGSWLRHERHQGKTWGEMLQDIDGRDYLWWKVRMHLKEEGGGEKFAQTPARCFRWWEWTGKYKEDAQRCLYMLQETDRLLEVFQAGQPDTGPQQEYQEP